MLHVKMLKYNVKIITSMKKKESFLPDLIQNVCSQIHKSISINFLGDASLRYFYLQALFLKHPLLQLLQDLFRYLCFLKTLFQHGLFPFLILSQISTNH